MEAKKFKTAIFYSISNCQPGLKGVSLGNFLIKRVAEKILQEIPSVKTFCTLSPIPGFNRWLETLSESQALDHVQDKKGKVAAAIKLLEPEGEDWQKDLQQDGRPQARHQKKGLL